MGVRVSGCACMCVVFEEYVFLMYIMFLLTCDDQHCMSMSFCSKGWVKGLAICNF